MRTLSPTFICHLERSVSEVETQGGTPQGASDEVRADLEDAETI